MSQPLVSIGANVGLPMSTTHVAIGAIAGLTRADVSRLNHQTLRAFAVAWTITPLCAAVTSGLVFRLLS